MDAPVASDVAMPAWAGGHAPSLASPRRHPEDAPPQSAATSDTEPLRHGHFLEVWPSLEPLFRDLRDFRLRAEDFFASFSQRTTLAASKIERPTSAWPGRSVALLGVLVVGVLVVVSLSAFSLQFAEMEAFPPRGPCSSAVSESLRWADVEYRENVKQRNWLFRGREGNVTAAFIKEVWLVPTFPCPHEARFGLWGEGGKWLCLSSLEPNPRPLVVSVGSNGDPSFEQEVARRLHAFSHTFDFTLQPKWRDSMHKLPFLKFHDAGLAGSGKVQETRAAFSKTFPHATILTVQEVLQRVGVQYVDVFKIDCEGCEYGVVEDMAEQFTRATVPFGQIQMELHLVEDYYAKEALNLIKTLETLGYRLFHTEVNGMYTGGFEIALIHESLVRPQ